MVLHAKSKNSTIVFDEPLRASLCSFDLSLELVDGVADGIFMVDLGF